MIDVTPHERNERVRSGGSLIYAYDFRKWKPYKGDKLAAHIAHLESLHTAGHALQAHDLCWLPRATALAWWNRRDVKFWFSDWALRTMIAVYDIAALDGALAHIAAGTVDQNHGPNFGPNATAIDGLSQVDSTRVAPLMVNWWAHDKKRGDRESAGDWLLKFPETTAVAIIPVAVGPTPGDAPAALRFLDGRGHGAVIRKVAATYGAAVATAVEDLLAAWTPPKKKPKLPAYLALPRLASVEKALLALCAWPPELREVGEKIDDEDPEADIDADSDEADIQIEDELAIERMWKVHIPRYHPDVLAAKAVHDTEALGTAVFDAWVKAGAPTRDKWVLFAAAALGGAATAKKIAAWITGASATQAIQGLDALMHLRARDAIATIAKAEVKRKKVSEHAAFLLRRLE